MSTFVTEKILSNNKPLKIEEEETMFLQKQGIVTILASESTTSKKWLSQNELSPMKKTSSSEGDCEEMKELEAEAEHDLQKPGPVDMWSSILSQKPKDQIFNSPPYVHPLDKKSKSFLSEKSLEICTESLGSESGSDGFSSYPSSETGETEETEEDKNTEMVKEEEVPLDDEELHVPKYNYTPKKYSPRSFPPPLSSQSLQMKPHRDNGRLFLQAVSVPPKNNFCAQRQDGRLVLTFATNLEEDDEYVSEEEDEAEKYYMDEEMEEEEFDEDDDEAEEDGVAEKFETVKEQAQILSSEVLALMMNKPIGLFTKSPRWSENFNFEVATKFKDVDGVQQQHSTLVEQSLPSTAEKAASPVPNPFFTHQPNHTYQTSNDGEKFVVVRGKNGDYLVHNLKSCKDSRRSFLFWESYCIATS